ncbi:MAG TPA: ABC transporter permease [Thermoanaerobaculia bacterium]|nr:ABC transporter permease [Thermoanaerobaculia bacterium]
MFSGAFRERVRNSWVEMRENPARSVLQALGVILGVAAVLGGFSISDSQRRRSDELYVRLGGLDKLNVQPNPIVNDGRPTALQTANLGLRAQDATEGEDLDRQLVAGASQIKNATARVRSAYADQERRISGIGGEFLATEGYEIAEGRPFSNEDMTYGAPVAILGTEPASVFFPHGDALGQTMRIGDVPVKVIGVFQERVFRFRKDQRNIFRWRNRIVAVPATLVTRRFEGDAYQRLDRVTFKMRDVDVISKFSKSVSGLLTANHRLQQDFRLDDVAARVKRRRSQGDAYDLIFWLSGVLSILGGGIVNVNIQMASLKERVREVGVKMAIGAPGREIFKEMMTEALLISGLGATAGLVAGIGFSKIITSAIGIPLYMDPKSFVFAFLLASAFGFLFALYPAFKAARLSPMEALRYE